MIAFYFDFISPYAYLGWKTIHALAARHGREVEPVPVLFAAMLDAHNNVGPAEVAAKRAYIFKEVVRMAHALGVPIAAPPSHPFNPLLALRVACVARPAAERRALIDALYAAVWAGQGGVESVDTVANAVRAAGLEPAPVLAEAQTPETKARLRKNTDDAIARGVFGVPTAIADGELFWGTQSFPHLEAFLEGKDPVTPALVERWAATPASAHRPR